MPLPPFKLRIRTAPATYSGAAPALASSSCWRNRIALVGGGGRERVGLAPRKRNRPAVDRDGAMA